MRKIGHPVIWIGAAIEVFDRKFNDITASPARLRRNGEIALILIMLMAAGSALLVEWLADQTGVGWLVIALIASSLIAQRSLAAHVAAVATALETGGVEAGRQAVGKIVGRDTARLDESGISRAAIESLAENFSDGITAPVFWLAIGGLPGIAIYKAINTADSMIGHRSEKYINFGRAAARIDDLVNWPAARLSAILVLIAATLVPSASARKAWHAIRHDAGRHRSPNAGWPEAAFAGALGLELAGPRRYDGKTIDDAVMGAGGRLSATKADIRRAITLFWITDMVLIVAVGLIAAVIHLVF